MGSKILALEARAGIGTGFSRRRPTAVTRDTVSVNCELITSRSGSSAGFGVGDLQEGSAVATKALSSRILANDSPIGVGAGTKRSGNVSHAWAINCSMEDISGNASINWGGNTDRCNVRVNGRMVQDTPSGCNHSLDDLCKYAAPDLVMEDCKPNNRLLMDIQQALKNIGHSHPLQPDFLNPQQVSQFGVCWTRPVSPTNVATSANNTVPVNISTPCCPPATAAPLTTGLGGEAVAGITLGVMAACVLLAGGAYVCYRYNRSDNSEGKQPAKDPEPS